MQNLGLTAADERQLIEALTSHHAVRVVVRLLDQDGSILTRLEQDVLGGQVNCSETGAQTRYLQLTLHARRAFAFEADGDWSGALNFNREMQVIYEVKSPDSEWVEVPVFTGPVVDFDRTADTLAVEAAGREWYAQGNVERAYTIKKGTPVVEAIRDVMRRCGERRFDFPDLKATLVQEESLSRSSVSWDVAQKLARSIDRQLFYDGAGRLRLRKYPTNAAVVFKDGDGGLLMTEPSVSPTMDGFANRVIVKGGEKKQAKQRDAAATDPDRKEKPDLIKYVAVAPRAHPMSPWNIGRIVDGEKVPRFVDHVEDNSHIRTAGKARELGDRLLEQKLAQTVEHRFEARPVPHLDVSDRFRFSTRDGGGGGRLREFTLPLELGQNMTVNYRARKSSHGARRGRPVAERRPA